jgi:hypothetical protein
VSLFRLATAALLLTVGLFAAHFMLVAKYAVNIPYLDEWEALTPGHLDSGVSLHWLFQQHNEHRIMPTKILTAALYWWDGWDIAVNQEINFLLYGVLLATILFCLYRFVSKEAFVVAALFNPFLLSTIDYENHLWGFQSQFHFFLIFFIIAAFLAFEQSTRLVALGAVAAVLCMFSFSSGVACALVLAGMISMHKIGQRWFVTTTVGIATLIWLWGYTRPSRMPLSLPWTAGFWKHFLNTVSLGFGWDSLALLPGVFCLAIVLIPAVGVFLRNQNWPCVTVVFGILASLALVSMGRGALGIEQAKSSRYAEIGMVLIPFTAVLWARFLSGRSRQLKILALGLFWLLCFVVFRNNFGYSMYAETYRMRQEAVECVYAYYEHGGPTICRTVYGEDISGRLETARRLNLSFYRTFKTTHKQTE